MSNVIKLHKPAGRIRKSSSSVRRTNSQYSSSHEGLPFLDEAERLQQAAQPSNAPEGNSPDNRMQSSESFDQQLRDEFKAGFDEGRRFTEKSLREELAASLAAERKSVQNLTQGITVEFGRFQHAAEVSVVKLALAIAERIVKREISIDKDLVLRQIHEATKRVVGVERIKLRVNPQDEEYIREHRSAILSTTDAVRELVVEGDDTIERGGCILESDSGNVDALLATQFERIEAALLTENIQR